MTFPPPPPSSQSSIASGTDKSSSSRPTRAQQSVWGSSSASQSSLRRGLTPLATNNLSSPSSTPSNTSREIPPSSSPGPGASTSSPLTSSFSAVLSSARGLPGGRNAPSPASTSSPFASIQPGSQLHQQHQHQQSGQSVSSPKFRAHTPSSGSHLASTAAVAGGGIGGGGGGTGSSRGVVFSPLSGTTVNSPTGFPSDKPGSSASGAAAHASQSSLTKISIAQVFLLLDSITEKEGKEKWETKAAQIHKVSDSDHSVQPILACLPAFFFAKYSGWLILFLSSITACRIQRNGGLFQILQTPFNRQCPPDLPGSQQVCRKCGELPVAGPGAAKSLSGHRAGSKDRRDH